MCRQSILIDQSIINTFIQVFRRISTEEIFSIKKKWSEISEINMPDSKLHGSLIKKLSISVAELLVILVGLLIIGRSDSEYIVFRNCHGFFFSSDLVIRTVVKSNRVSRTLSWLAPHRSP